MIRYRDFDTLKEHSTRAVFVRWERGGPLNALYAVLCQPKTGNQLAIPEYCLTRESRKHLPAPGAEVIS